MKGLQSFIFILLLIGAFKIYSQNQKDSVISNGANMMCECFGDQVIVNKAGNPTQFCLRQITFALQKEISSQIKANSKEEYEQKVRSFTLAILEQSILDCDAIYESSLLARDQAVVLIQEDSKGLDFSDTTSVTDSIYRQQAYHLLGTKDYDGAIGHVDIALNKNRNAKNLLCKSIILETKGDLNQSLNQVEEAIVLEGSNPILIIQKAILRRKLQLNSKK